MALIDAFFSLSGDVNKVGYKPTSVDGVGELLPELTLTMPDEELLTLEKDWIKTWTPFKSEIEKKQKDNEDYWLGSHFNASKDTRPMVDNLIFESLETFLPIATRPKADPLVESDNTEEGNALADKVRKMLAFKADELSYNLILKQVARYWALYMLGVMKVGWSMKENDITCIAIRPQKLILDPTATVEAGEYTGYYIGEILEDVAADLVLRFPSQSSFITEKVKGKMGTKCVYTMWTTNDYVFWTFAEQVLAKTKNPHWNYDTEQPTSSVDEYGNAVQSVQQVKGHNHFKNRKKPYIFLSIFNLGKQPHDDTNLVQQNIGLQDLINKRLLQIDKNADNANGGLALSGDSFTEEQAAKAGKAKRNGGVIWVPTGPVANSVVELTGSPLPPFVYDSLIDYRNELRNIFGTRGSTPQGTINEQTVGGKQIIKAQDTDRIGGGISTYLEQFSDNVFNWFVQLMYVYYDEPHTASVLGAERAQEYISLVNSEFIGKLSIGVKEGSMIPHDPASQRGEALELWAQQGIDPITFFDRLEFPNPRESAKNLYLWMSDPVALFPDLQAQQQMQMQMEQQQMMGQDQNAQAQQMQQQAQIDAQQADQGQIHKLQQIHLQGLLKPKLKNNAK
jgi:hypothetical protein